MGDKSYKIFMAFLCVAIICGTIIVVNQISYKKLLQSKKGTILRHEDFRGHKVPIKADGKGGTYRWMADVPWDVFTIEEKFDWARVRGGLLSDKDIAEIKGKYGVK